MKAKKQLTERECIEALCRKTSDMIHTLLVKRTTLIVDHLHEVLDEQAKALRVRNSTLISNAKSYLKAFEGRLNPLDSDAPWPNQNDLAIALDYIEELCEALEQTE